MTKVQLKRKLKSLISGIRRIGLHNRTFSILSNNCWGGMIYDVYGLQYRTPTIGLWIPAQDYIRFLSNIDFYLKEDLKSINYKDCHVANLLIQRKECGKYKQSLDNFIIGRLYDVDIIFLHYKSFKEARDKWNRRKKRINRKNLIVKFNDQNDFEISDYRKFRELQFENKIFITANSNLVDDPSVIYLEQYKKNGYVVDDTKLSELPFDIKNYLNSIIL